MKRLIFAALVLVSALAFSFESKAQTVKRYAFTGTPLVQVDDGLQTGELDDITNSAKYGSGTSAGTTLPTSDANCAGSVYVCSLYILFPSSCNHSLAQILAAIKTYINTNGWQAFGSPFSVTISGCTYDVVFFGRNS